MNESVLDASVVLAWFIEPSGREGRAARKLRSEFEAGDLFVLAPPLIQLELLNAAGRRWLWDEPRLVELVATLDGLGFDLVEPDLRAVARWVAARLTAYDGAYVAVAEATGVPLITADEHVLTLAPDIARPPSSMG